MDKEPARTTGVPTLAAVGDLGILGDARRRGEQDGYDTLFQALAPEFRRADLGFANLEFPLGRPEWMRKGPSPEFRHDDRLAPALSAAGIRLVSLANSHMMDCGVRGLENTLALCRKEGIGTFGAGMSLEEARRPFQCELRGMRLLFLGYTMNLKSAAGPAGPGMAPLIAEMVQEDLRRWRPECDRLIVSAHWGTMYVDYRPPQVGKLARMMASEGADLILGHHPHVVQGWEWIGRCLVLYSMGDIVFNTKCGDIQPKVGQDIRRETAVFHLALEQPTRVELSPFRLDEDGIPAACRPEESQAQLERWRRISERLPQADALYVRESAPSLLEYELDSVIQLLRQGRPDKVLRILLTMRPRHLRQIGRGLAGLAQRPFRRS